ncbi:MAG: ParB/RepB/Spo0J family partition protein [Alphaproteobacteria bacterium]
MTDARRRGLARGLSALLGEDALKPEAGPAPAGARTLPVAILRPNRLQPRRRYPEEEIRALADSILEKGLVQPILVRPLPADEGAFEIVAGERRWRAAQLARVHEVPVVVRELTDREALEVSLVENIQRADLTALEEAEGYRHLLDEFGHTQEAVARAVGKSRSHVANTVRLLTLPGAVKAMVQDGALSAGHGRALLAARNPLALARRVVEEGLNVRQTEMLASQAEVRRRRFAPAGEGEDAERRDLERRLSERLGLSVTIRQRGESGEVRIRYQTLEQLDDLLRRLVGDA